jgi:ribonuclease VapC
LILDSSAVVTVLRREEGYRRYVSTLDEATDAAIGAPTLLETEIVAIRRFGPTGRERVARFLDHYGIVAIPFDDSHRYAAADAFIRYGKGRHPAALNYGDCMTYATAYVADHPLLFTGDDFAKTDIAVA